MPLEASAMIRENLEWTTPVSMVPRIQALHPHITAKQIHAAWTVMSEVIWKRDKDQLQSSETLLKEFTDDTDLFDVKPTEGVQQVCWGLKRIARQLRGKIVEIGIDATCMWFLV
jgi:hypothetical protein